MKGLEAPYAPAPYEAHHAGAVQALMRGDCPEHLQKEFMRWLIEDCCGTYESSFRKNPYNMAYFEGKRSCGNAIVYLANIDIKKLTEKRSKDQ